MELDMTEINQMAALKAALFDMEDTHQTKIQFIKEELAANRYQINSSLIADKLLEYAQQELELSETV